jgi:hypothetical protein
MNASATRIAGLAVSLATLALVVTGVVGATSSSVGGSTAALDNVATSQPPAAVAATVEQLARFAKTDPAAALRNVRLVRHGAGATATDIYAFKNQRGRPCIVVPAVIGFCEPESGTSPVGLDWSIGGGDPQTPSKFIAVYTDQVVGVSLTIDGAGVPVSMSNNVAYAEYPSASTKAVFWATYRNGRTSSTTTLNLTG